MIINGIEYKRIDYTDRLSILVRVDGDYPKHAQGLRRALLKAGKNTCEQCGSKIKLEAHHKNKTRYLKTNKGHYYQDPSCDHSASNGIMLCKKCHLKLHNIK
jgi:hypothetical protein